MHFEEQYPNKPPSVKFISEMFHPNVYATGELCLDILQNRWSPTYDVAAVLTSIQRYDSQLFSWCCLSGRRRDTNNVFAVCLMTRTPDRLRTSKPPTFTRTTAKNITSASGKLLRRAGRTKRWHNVSNGPGCCKSVSTWLIELFKTAFSGYTDVWSIDEEAREGSIYEDARRACRLGREDGLNVVISHCIWEASSFLGGGRSLYFKYPYPLLIDG